MSYKSNGKYLATACDCLNNFYGGIWSTHLSVVLDFIREDCAHH